MKYLQILTLVLIGIACGDDGDGQQHSLSFQDLDVVTGIDLTDASGALVGLWRSPNQNTGGSTAFPNPAGDVVNLAVNPSSIAGIQEVLVVPATCLLDRSTTDIPLKSLSLSYTRDEVASLSAKTILLDTNPSTLQLDLSDLTTGFYKVFYIATDDNLYWINVYKDASLAGQPVLSFQALDQACD